MRSFGFLNVRDLYTSAFGALGVKALKWSAAMGFLQLLVKSYLGIDLMVLLAFALLIAAEWFTGIRASLRQGEKLKSRKLVRMVVKIGVYSFIIFLLHAFEGSLKAPEVLGLVLNPFSWLYNAVLIAIVFQLVVSLFENLGRLGYKESKTLAGIVLRKFNKWFAFDAKQDDNGRQ